MGIRTVFGPVSESDPEPRTTADAWPDCDPAPVRVLVLGIYHMDDPELNAVNLDVDDVLEPDRQTQLRDLVDRLGAFEADRVALERPFERTDDLNAQYEAYRTGEHAYDEYAELDSTDPKRADSDDECRSEVVQVGFRLADRHGHDRVLGIDEYPEPPESDPFADREVDPARTADVSVPDADDFERWHHEALSRLTVPEFLAWRNDEAVCRSQAAIHHDIGFRGSEAGPGLGFLRKWYDRNLRMVQNLRRGVEGDDERAVVVVGAGHVPVLRHLLDATPAFCPESPLPYLPTVPDLDAGPATLGWE